MDNAAASPGLSAQQSAQLLDMMGAAFEATSLDQFAACVLPEIALMVRSPSILLYVSDPRLAEPAFFQHGIRWDQMLDAESICADHFGHMSEQSIFSSIHLTDLAVQQASGQLELYPLTKEKQLVGLLGLGVDNGRPSFPQDLLDKLLHLLASAVLHLIARRDIDRQLAHLNSYLTVSSMLAQSQDLREELEVALYCCMEEVAAETASVLLLDDEKQNFLFYQVEGPSKPVLETAVFPADRGLAGAVLQSQQSEVINHVPSDPRFYNQIDADSGFQTRNMIVIPLTAGEEKVGVLEVLNKADGSEFSDDDHLLMLSIAEEIAFAIRNAKVFEYVVNSYCKQRQGQASCRGCQRPLGSWTPCVKYREALL
jgi:putative methionine-R-sulfoxide reductase with GAF domain